MFRSNFKLDANSVFKKKFASSNLNHMQTLLCSIVHSEQENQMQWGKNRLFMKINKAFIEMSRGGQACAFKAALALLKCAFVHYISVKHKLKMRAVFLNKWSASEKRFILLIALAMKKNFALHKHFAIRFKKALNARHKRKLFGFFMFLGNFLGFFINFYAKSALCNLRI